MKCDLIYETFYKLHTHKARGGRGPLSHVVQRDGDGHSLLRPASTSQSAHCYG